MIQEIIVYIIVICAVVYIFRRIFGKKKENPCGSCTACSEKEKQEKDKLSCDCPLKNQCQGRKNKEL